MQSVLLLSCHVCDEPKGLPCVPDCALSHRTFQVGISHIQVKAKTKNLLPSACPTKHTQLSRPHTSVPHGTEQTTTSTPGCDHLGCSTPPVHPVQHMLSCSSLMQQPAQSQGHTQNTHPPARTDQLPHKPLCHSSPMCWAYAALPPPPATAPKTRQRPAAISQPALDHTRCQQQLQRAPPQSPASSFNKPRRAHPPAAAAVIDQSNMGQTMF